MIPCPCDGCDRPRRGTEQICGACAADITRALEAVPSLAAELDVTLARQGTRPAGGRSSTVPLPYDPRATEAATVLRSALVGWVREIVRDGEDWPGDTLPDMAVWLSERRTRLLGHPAAEEAHGEIVAAVRAAERVVDRAPSYIYAGPCPECDTSMFAAPGAAVVTCRPCRSNYNVEDRRDWMRDQLEDLLGSSSYVAMVCTGMGVKVSPSTVRMWVKRKKLAPRHFVAPLREGGKPRPVYRVGDVVKVATGQHEPQHAV